MWETFSAGSSGYSHMLGGFAGGGGVSARTHADVGPIKVPSGLTD